MKTHVESHPSGSPGKDDPAAASVTSYCDLVMKGGITSGVIYPKLISQLAAKYTFKNIGGTSAGAIAAGGCAAAEYGRSHGNGEAFRDLEGLPEFLSKKTEPSGRSKLFTLFQPTDALRSHFEVLVEALNLKPEAAAKRVVLALLKMHLALVFSGLVVGTLLLWPMVRALAPGASGVATLGVAGASVVLALLAAFLGAMLAARGPLAMAGAVILAAAAVVVIVGRVLGVDLAWWTAGAALAMVVFALLVLAVVLLLVVYRFGTTLLRGLHANGYGICSGQSTNSGSGALPGLTNWLAQYFNDLAGLPSGHHPLTFGDLWGTTDWKEPRQVNLEVMTSAISQQMVYGIPFREGTPRFYYDVEEWSKLFPSTVIEWLEKAQKATPEGDGSEPLPAGASVISAAGKALRVLPRRADLPVVVAVRMSLSFPILLSAVPLYAIDWGRTENQQKKKQLEAAAKEGSPTAESVVATRVWFSDGGIGSNMPLHMFDALLPGHPTFAVNLKPPHPDYPIVESECADNNGGRIYLPDSNVGGRLRYWPRTS